MSTSYPALKNDLFLRALRREKVDRTPVWMMRQAGRYLPEYREVRAKAGDFMALCTNPALACEVTLQPLRRYKLDAAILFSDILTIPDALGLGLYFEPGEGPKFRKPLASDSDIENLGVVKTASDLSYVTDAVSTIRRALNGDVPLIGFSGSPWTLATYMLEGGSSRDFPKAKGLIYQKPELADLLMDKLADSIIDYLSAQIDAGAQVVQIFDSWGGALSHHAYQRFSLNPMKKIVEKLKSNQKYAEIPVILFSKGGGQWLSAMAESGTDALGLDWTTKLSDARQLVGNKVALQGNMDPAVLRSNPESIRAEVDRILSEFGSGSGHIFNLGHGITPDVTPENAGAFIKAVHDLSPKYHS